MLLQIKTSPPEILLPEETTEIWLEISQLTSRPGCCCWRNLMASLRILSSSCQLALSSVSTDSTYPWIYMIYCTSMIKVSSCETGWLSSLNKTEIDVIVKVDIRKERRTRHYLRGWHTLRRRSGRGWGSVFPLLWEEKGQAGRSKVLPRHARSSGWGRTELQSWWQQRHTKQDINHSSIFLFWTFRDSGRLKNPIFEQGNGKLRNGKLKKQLSEELERQIDQSSWFTL